MPDQQTQPDSQLPEMQDFPRLIDFMQTLKDANVDEETVALLGGRFVSKINDLLTEEILETVGDIAGNPALEGIQDAVTLGQTMQKIYTEKTQKSVDVRKAELAEEYYQNFLAAGNPTA